MSCIRCAEAPLCEAQSFSQGKRTEARIQCGLGFAKQFCGKGFAKPRLISFRQNSHFAVQEGAGGMHGGFFWREAVPWSIILHPCDKLQQIIKYSYAQ